MHCAARLVGLRAIRDASKFDPAALDALIAEYAASQGLTQQKGQT